MQLIDGAMVSIGLSIGAWITIALFVIRTAMRFGALELKVDTMWGFQMRRAMSEVVTTGLGAINSPLLLAEDTMRTLETLKEPLTAWYATVVKAVDNDAELLLGIEAQFGDGLMKLVCLPCHLSYGACLIIALAVAKAANPVDIDLSVARDSKHSIIPRHKER